MKLPQGGGPGQELRAFTFGTGAWEYRGDECVLPPALRPACCFPLCCLLSCFTSKPPWEDKLYRNDQTSPLGVPALGIQPSVSCKKGHLASLHIGHRAFYRASLMGKHKGKGVTPEDSVWRSNKGWQHLPKPLKGRARQPVAV